MLAPTPPCFPPVFVNATIFLPVSGSTNKTTRARSCPAGSIRATQCTPGSGDTLLICFRTTRTTRDLFTKGHCGVSLPGSRTHAHALYTTLSGVRTTVLHNGPPQPATLEIGHARRATRCRAALRRSPPRSRGVFKRTGREISTEREDVGTPRGFIQMAAVGTCPGGGGGDARRRRPARSAWAIERQRETTSRSLREGDARFRPGQPRDPPSATQFSHSLRGKLLERTKPPKQWRRHLEEGHREKGDDAIQAAERAEWPPHAGCVRGSGKAEGATGGEMSPIHGAHTGKCTAAEQEETERARPASSSGLNA